MWTSILKAPFWTLYGLLVFILYKDLHASAFQIALFLALKPIVSIFSIYWSSFVNNRQDRLVSNIVVAAILGHLPFFFFPFVDNVWFFIFAGALYMLLTRGVVPAWMEILKINTPPLVREKVFSYSAAMSYVGGAILPLFIGNLFDTHPGIWRWFFPATSLFSLSSLFFLLRIPTSNFKAAQLSPFSFREQIIQPWKNALILFSKHNDFRQFQIGFLFGGSGLMLMQPALPQFFFDSLHISYAELTIALAVCKSVGFIITTKFWADLMTRINIFKFSAYVTFAAALFPLLLLLAQVNLTWLYISYLTYGIMQAGSELSWHLSGPIFAKNEDSSPFSSVNVVTVGLRGCVAPFLGSFLCNQMSASYVLIFGSLFCLYAMMHMLYHKNCFEQQLHVV